MTEEIPVLLGYLKRYDPPGGRRRKRDTLFGTGRIAKINHPVASAAQLLYSGIQKFAEPTFIQTIGSVCFLFKADAIIKPLVKNNPGGNCVAGINRHLDDLGRFAAAENLMIQLFFFHMNKLFNLDE